MYQSLEPVWGPGALGAAPKVSRSRLHLGPFRLRKK